MMRAPSVSVHHGSKPVKLSWVSMLLLGIGLLTGTTLLSIMLGTVYVPPLQIIRCLANLVGWLPDSAVQAEQRIIILFIRMPRVFAASLAGAGLATAGTVMQGLFRNPMAEPGILGVSAGAGLGALIAIFAGITVFFMLPLYAFAGAILAVLIILAFTVLSGGRVQTTTLILSGLAISSLFSALTSLTLMLASEYQVSTYIFWTLGGLANRRWEHVLAMLIPVVATLIIILFKANDLRHSALRR